MSNDDDHHHTPEDAGPPGKPGYDVGYGKPPPAHRFKPGQSGNPRGRRKGSKNKLPPANEDRMSEMVLKQAYRTIPVKLGDRIENFSMLEANLHSMALSGAKGNVRAAKAFHDCVDLAHRRLKASQEATPHTPLQSDEPFTFTVNIGSVKPSTAPGSPEAPTLEKMEP